MRNRQRKLNKWIVLWSAIGIGMILGILYVWSVISKGLMNELGWTSTQASLPYTVFTVCMSLGFFVSGRVQDKLGPRICVAFCAVMMGAGLALGGVFTTPWMVMLGFGIICGLGVGSGNAASLAPALKWFPASKNGMVSGAALAGIAFSAVIYSPVSNILLGSIGVSNSFLVFGAVSFIVMFLLSFNMNNPPAGYDREKGEKVKKDDSPAAQTTGKERTLKQALRTRNFYLLFIIFAISSSAGLMIIAHAAKIAQVQIGWESGFLLVIVMNVFNMAGRFLGGSISDKIGRVNTFRLIFAVQAANMALFSFYSNIPLIVLGILIQGFCYGTIFSVMPSMTADMYGLNSFGAIYGTIFLAWGIGGIIGPMTAARVFDSSGTYDAAYLIACALSLVSLVLAFLLLKRKQMEAML
jgi:MFS family permease